MADNRKTPASAIALGGILAAAAGVIMGMGTLIPVATYVCPMICTLLLQVVLKTCGRRFAWAWYGCVSILGLLFAPDKEAAIIFCFIGNYPILKPKMDAKKARWLWKGLYFNLMILAAYKLMLGFLGLDDVLKDFAEMGKIMLAILLILGNVTFFLLDRLLGMGLRRRRR